MDLVVRCAALPSPGQTILANSSAEFCGGKGANQAAAAALAGGQVSMIGAVGDDAFADRLVENLRVQRVDVSHVMRRAGRASGLAVISVDDSGQNSIMVVPGANGLVTKDDVLAANTLIQRADSLLVQLEIPIDVVLAGIAIARAAGVRVLLDPAPAVEDLPPALMQVDMLCPNESEAAMLSGQPVESVDQADTAAKKLQAMGATNIAITLGNRGTLLRHGGQSELVPAYPVDAVDSTAAGDAFAGAFAVHWSKTDNLIDAVRFGNAAGALAASRHGAQASLATEDEIESLWKTQV